MLLTEKKNDIFSIGVAQLWHTPLIFWHTDKPSVPSLIPKPESSSFVERRTSVLFVCLFLGGSVSLCSPGCPGPHSVDQAVLELRNSPASAFQCWD